MKISPLSNSNSLTTKSWSPHFTKEMLRPSAPKPVQTESISSEAIKELTEVIPSADDILKSFGITYCKGKDHKINIACGYNGGFYIVKSRIDISRDDGKSFIINAIRNQPYILGGFLNYKDLVRDVKRQDIIKKGLQVHTFELNNDVEYHQRFVAADNLSKYTGKYLDIKDLFYIENDAFYYDKASGKVYSVNLYSKNTKNIKLTYRTCEFIKDKQGNAIGYTLDDYDFYHVERKKYEYLEQQTPSQELKPILGNDNNKLLAEGFRFGNAKITYKELEGAKKVVDILVKKLDTICLSKNDLQIIKFKDKKGDINTRISYYDPTIGNSFVFDKEGKYLYQLEYNRDTHGQIIACAKI